MLKRTAKYSQLCSMPITRTLLLRKRCRKSERRTEGDVKRSARAERERESERESRRGKERHPHTPRLAFVLRRTAKYSQVGFSSMPITRTFFSALLFALGCPGAAAAAAALGAFPAPVVAVIEAALCECVG